MSQPLSKEALKTYPHIEFDEMGVARILGTTMKVVDLVEAQEAYGWSPAELHFQNPLLSLGQIHGALSYYWDHRAELDADRERRFQFAEECRRAAGPSLLGAKLRALGLKD
jgi:uncharacterized protein (DUF433 family)